jgi:hypothetical protein
MRERGCVKERDVAGEQDFVLGQIDHEIAYV